MVVERLAHLAALPAVSMEPDVLRLFSPIIDDAKAMKFGQITVTFTVRNGQLYGVEVVPSLTHKKWTLQDVANRTSVLE